MSGATFSATAITSFVAFGTATSNNPIALTYDTSAQAWSASSVTLVAGSLQYIANQGATDGSVLTYGQGTQDSYHVKSGASTKITVSTAGTYDIKLVLNVPDNYTDTLKIH